MKMKKIAAAILSLGMILTTIPQMYVSAAAEEILYSEDFESDSYDKRFDNSSTKEYWKNCGRVKDDDGNMVMKYEFTETDEAWDRMGPVRNVDLPVKLEQDGTFYEISYKFKPTKGQVLAPYLGVAGKYGGASIFSIDTNTHWTLIYGTAYKGADNMFINRDIDGYVTFRAIVNPKQKSALVFITCKDTDGKIIDNKYEATGITINASTIDAFRLTMSTFYAPADKTTVLFDDICVKKLPNKVVTFETNGANETVSPITTIFDYITLPETTLTKDGWQFDGWYIDKELTKPFDGTGVADDMTVYAKWLKVHTVSFETNGGEPIEPIGTVTDRIELPTPIKTRYECVGWFKDEELTEPFDGTGITGDMTVYAKWEYAWKISFNTNGGDPIEPMYAAHTLKNIPEGTWLGYRFDGWFKDEELTEPFDGTNLTEDIEVFAKWTKKYRIDFESNGGGEFDPVYTLEDIDPAILPIPKKQGFSLEGWYKDEELTEPFDGTGITGDMTLYAKYNNIIYYQDFENISESENEELLKQLAPNKYKEFIKNGYGVTEGPDGGKAFRFAWEARTNIMFKFEDGGPGLYEITFRMTYPKKWCPFAACGTPMQGNKEIVGTSCGNYYTIGSSGMYFLGAFGAAEDYVNFKYYIDTENKVCGFKADYLDRMTKKTVSASGNLLSFTNDSAGINCIKFAPHYNIGEQGTDYYLDDLCIKKIDQPYIESIVPADNEKDVDINSQVTVRFSEAVDKSTITNETLSIVDEDGNSVPSFIKFSTENGKTVATVKPEQPLEYEKNYTVMAGLGIFKGNYNLKHSYEFKFKTRPLAIEYFTTLTDSETGENIEKLTEAKGKKVKATLTVRNYAGADEESYFAGTALTDMSTGRQYMYTHAEGIVAKGESKEVISKEFSIPASVTDNYKINFYVWSAAENRNVLTDVITLP